MPRPRNSLRVPRRAPDILVPLTCRCPRRLVQGVRLAAVREDRPMQVIVAEAFREYLARRR